MASIIDGTEIDPELLEEHAERLREFARDAADASELEHAVCTAVLPFAASDLPDEPFLAVLEALERTGDRLTATLLEAIGLLARGRPAAAARKAAERLSASGTSANLPPGFAALAVTEAQCVDLGEGEILLLGLRRSQDERPQSAFLVLDHADHGGALIAGSLTRPLTDDPGLDALLIADDPEAPPVPREPIAVEALAERIRGAARRSAELGLAVDYELGLALPLLARALTGTSDGLAALEVHPPAGPLDVDPGDQAAYEAVTAELLGTFEDWLGNSTGDRVLAAADQLLEFKFGHGDGRLGEWSAGDLEAFLLDYAPRRIVLHPAHVEALPGDLLTFLRFIAEAELLDGDPLDRLEQAALALREEYLAAARDPRRFGPAKALLAQMRLEGVEPTDDATMQRWIEDFNARPDAERDRVLGPALGFPKEPRRRSGRRSKKQKATKQARRRNRR